MTSVDRGPFWHAQSWSRHWITPSADITSVQIDPAGARKQLKEGGLAWICLAKEFLEIVGQRAWELFLDLGLRVWFSNLFFKSWLSTWWCLFNFTLISQLPAPTLSPRSPSLGSGDELLPNLSIRGVTRRWRTRSWWHCCGDRDSSWVVDRSKERNRGQGYPETDNIGVVFRPFRTATSSVKSHGRSEAEGSFRTGQSVQRGYTGEGGQGRAVN